MKRTKKTNEHVETIGSPRIPNPESPISHSRIPNPESPNHPSFRVTVHRAIRADGRAAIWCKLQRSAAAALLLLCSIEPGIRG